MKKFLDENFLLSTKTASELYHESAEPMPIIDYHNHLPPADITEDRKFSNIFEAWLEGDHYKWRAMRTLGIDEEYITGNASPREKFNAWAQTVPYTVGNPLYHWTHLELKRYFGINDLLSPETSEKIWKDVNEKLQDNAFSARGLLKKMNVEVLCTTDDPADSLEHHKKHSENGSPDVIMLPAFRPDNTHKFLNLTSWQEYIKKLGSAAEIKISGWQDLAAALKNRHDYFNANGCRVSDHGIEYIPDITWSIEEADKTIKKALNGEMPEEKEILALRCAVLEECGKMDAESGWVMQIHMGALRNVNTSRFNQLGADTGFDVIGDFPIAKGLASFLDRLERENLLPKTILYVLNPRDNEVIGTITGAFQKDTPGKIQFGSGWWFNDQKDGMIRQLTALANLGMLSKFVGMLTDSRSFLSFPRHEYFRRILSSLFGSWIENGEIPYDRNFIHSIIKDISYNNAGDYFNFT